MNHFHIAAVTTPGGQINQVTTNDVDPQIQEMLEAYDGQVHPTFAAVLTQKALFRFGTGAVSLALGYIGVNGLAMTGTGADFYFQKAANGGTRNTADCTRLSCTHGLMCIDTIDAEDGAPAVANFSAYPVSSDGLAVPMSVTSGISLPSQLATRQVYTLGPAYVNGTRLLGLKGWSLQLNMSVTVDTFDGEVYPRLAYIGTCTPRFVCRTPNIELVESLGLFSAQSATDSVLYLRKVAQGGTRVPNTTAEHIGLSVDDGMTIARRINGGNGQPAMAEIEIVPTFDGTNPIIAVNRAVAIPTDE